MSLSHTELSFGDFSGLSQEEYQKLFSTLSRPLRNNKVQFPWNEEEYIQSGIQALSIGDIPLGDISNYVVSDNVQTNVTSLDCSARSMSEDTVSQNQTKPLATNEETPTSAENFEGNAEQDYSLGNGDDEPGGAGAGNNGAKRRRKKKRDPSYYLKYYNNPELYHNEHTDSEAKNTSSKDYRTEQPNTQTETDYVDGGNDSDSQRTCQGETPISDCVTSTPQTSVVTNNIDADELRPNPPIDTNPIPPRTTQNNTQEPPSESVIEADKTISVDPVTTPSQTNVSENVQSEENVKSDGTNADKQEETSVSSVPDSSKLIANEDTSSPVTTDSAQVTEEESPKGENIVESNQSAPSDSPAISDENKPDTDKKDTSPSEGAQDAPSENDNKPKVSSWAGLFKNTTTPSGGPIAYVSHASSGNESGKSQTGGKKSGDVIMQDKPVSPEEDKLAKELGEFLLTVKFPYRALALTPRGLNNVGNWCYVNAILQALLSCPPLYNLLKSLPVTPLSSRGQSSTPMMDSLGEFVSEFTPMAPKPGGKRTAQDLRPGAPFEPTYIYNLLTLLKSSMSIRGRQEDAEEFLGFILNGLHEEMLSCTRYVNSSKEDTKADMNGPSLQNSNGPSDARGATSPGEAEDEDDDEEWEQVGPKNKSSITRSANFTQSLISDIFGGQMRSAVQQHGSKESATLQPFFTLQLDIQSEKIWSVKDALQSLVSRETLHDYTSPKSKAEVETFRRITLEVLPPVLILHLKRFVYDKSGGSQKLQKKIEYNMDLEISKELLSSVVKSKLSLTQRSYKLFSIVYHHGKTASGGHYTCDFYHPGINGWIRTDDSNVKPVSINSILRPTLPKVPYLLFYRRCDLI